MGLGALGALAALSGQGGRERRKGVFEGKNVLLESYERLTGRVAEDESAESVSVFLSFVKAWKELGLGGYSDDVAGMGMVLFDMVGVGRAREGLGVLKQMQSWAKEDGGRISDEWVLMCYLSSEVGCEDALERYQKLFSVGKKEKQDKREDMKAIMARRKQKEDRGESGDEGRG